MYRSRRERRDYDRYLRLHDENECVFCSPSPEQLVGTTAHFFIVRNRFQYSFWDYCTVTDHLMIVPKQHVDALGKVSDAAKVEFTQLVDRYESAGYNIYGRPAGSTIKTISHQHTHCIKTNNQRSKFLLFLQRPYIRIKF